MYSKVPRTASPTLHWVFKKTKSPNQSLNLSSLRLRRLSESKVSFYDHLVNLLINEFKKLVDLMIFQIACIPQTEERNFPGRKLNFSKLSLKYSLLCRSADWNYEQEWIWRVGMFVDASLVTTQISDNILVQAVLARLVWAFWQRINTWAVSLGVRKISKCVKFKSCSTASNDCNHFWTVLRIHSVKGSSRKNCHY